MNDLEFEKKLQHEIDMEHREKLLKQKKLIINERRTEIELDKLIESDRSELITKQADFNILAPAYVEDLVEESTSYMAAARNGMGFINDSFAGIVPFFRKNLLLIGGESGQGKSTCVANIVFNIIGQFNPETGKRRRCLVITNEEKAEDFYNRITCLGKKWAYVNHGDFTPQQVEFMGKGLRNLANSGLLTVVADNHAGALGTTTTLEGIRDIFQNLIANKHKYQYDAILIDYYQNIKASRQDPYLSEYDVQQRVAYMLDGFKNIYPAPIVLLSQIKPDAEGKEPFEFRIKGRKIIYDVSTFALEMIRNNERLSTQWVIRKSRFAGMLGTAVTTGFDRGRFVEYTAEFQANVSRHFEEKEAQKILKAACLPEKKRED